MRLELLTVWLEELLPELRARCMHVYCLRCVLKVLGQKDTKRPGEVCDSVSVVQLDVHSSVEGSAPDHSLQLHLANGVQVLFLVDPLVNLCYESA